MNQRGLSLLEAVVSIVILLTVIMGVAFLFSTGKGNVDRLSWRRAALTQAQLRLEQLLHNPAAADTTASASNPFNQRVHNGAALKLDGVRSASEYWYIWYEDDAVDSLKTSNPADGYPWDNRRVREVVLWSTGISANKDSVVVESIIPG